jgi:hypothetical protein
MPTRKSSTSDPEAESVAALPEAETPPQPQAAATESAEPAAAPAASSELSRAELERLRQKLQSKYH